MISNTQHRTLSTSSNFDSADFGISARDTTHLTIVLRDTLYSDKILAVLREYSSNAWDAHRDAGKHTDPISVRLPTADEPSLSIRDYGAGLSHDDVFHIFTQYGASTKRGSNATVGCLGLGSKSGFCYADSFMIISRHGGRARTYVAVLDTSERGQLKLLSEADCDPLDTGLEIVIGVKPQDINDFHSTAQKLFAHFKPRPIINCDLPLSLPCLEHGALSSSTGWVAVMGCVPYPVDLKQFPHASFVEHLGGVLYFDIGDLHVAASREQLKYSDETKAKLQQKLEAFLDEYVTTELAALAQPSLSSWERRLRAQPLRRFKLNLTDAATKGLLASKVELPAKAQHYDVTLSYSERGAKYDGVDVSKHTRLVVRDDRKALSGYSLHSSDYVVRPRTKGLKLADLPAVVAIAEQELQQQLRQHGLDGVPLVRASSLKWEKEGRSAPEIVGPRSPKHRAKMFVYRGTADTPLSSNWDVVERAPEDGDLYVDLVGFKARSCDFYNVYRRCKRLLEAFGLPVPVVYGYKQKCKAKRVGQDFEAWSDEQALRLLTTSDAARELLAHKQWADLLDDEHRRTLTYDDLVRIATKLGNNHAVTTLLRRAKAGLDALRSMSYDKKRATETLHALLGRSVANPAAEALAAVYAAYPLLKAQGQEITVLWSGSDDAKAAWLDYVKEKTS